MCDIKKLEAQKAALEEKIEELKQREERLAALSEDRQMAIYLHDTCCKRNHIDECAWLYDMENDIPKFSRPDSLHYLSKAQRLIGNGFSLNDVKTFCEIIKNC